MEIFLIIIISIAYILIIQLLVGRVVNNFYDKVAETAIELQKKKNTDEGRIKYKESGIDKEADDIKMIKEKKKELGFITITVGIFEILGFGFLTVLLLGKYIYAEVFIALFKYIGGWIAIKALGNYGQWSGAILGRACFYIFIIGTFLNIISAILLGFGIWYVEKFI